MILSAPRGTSNALYIENLAHAQYKYQKVVLFYWARVVLQGKRR